VGAEAGAPGTEECVSRAEEEASRAEEVSLAEEKASRAEVVEVAAVLLFAAGRRGSTEVAAALLLGVGVMEVARVGMANTCI
jgi:hypothetical protein